MPNTDFQSPAITFTGPFNTQTGMYVNMFPFSNKNYDDVFISANWGGDVYALYGGSSFSNLPTTMTANDLSGANGFQTTGTTGIAGNGYSICSVKNFLDDGRNAMVMGYRGEGSDRDVSLVNFYSYVIFYSPSIGATLNITSDPNILKFQSKGSSIFDENGRALDSGIINNQGIIVFGAPGTPPANGNNNILAGAVNLVCGQTISNTTSKLFQMSDVTSLKIINNNINFYARLGSSVKFIPNLLNGNPGLLFGEPGNRKAYLMPLNPSTLCNLGQTFDLNTLNGQNGVAITSTITDFGVWVAYGDSLLGSEKPGIVILTVPTSNLDPGAFVVALDSSLFNQASISIEQLRTAGKAIAIKGLSYSSWPTPPSVYKNSLLLGGNCGTIINIEEGDITIDASTPDGEKVVTIPTTNGECGALSMVAGNAKDDNTVTVAKAIPFSSPGGSHYAGHVDFYFTANLSSNATTSPSNSTSSSNSSSSTGSTGGTGLSSSSSSSSSTGLSLTGAESSSSSSSTGTSGGIGLTSSSSSSSSTGLSSTGLHSSSSSSSTGISAGSTGIIGSFPPPTTNASQNNPSLGFAAVAAISSIGGIGSILLMAIFLLLWNRSRSKKKFKKYVAEQDDSRKEIIRSLADKIFAKFSTTRFGHIPETQMAKYIEAIKQIAIALEKQGVDLQDAGLVDAVTQQITLAILPQSTTTLFSSRRAITPELLTQHCGTIANGVAIELGYAEPGAMPAVSVINVNGDREYGNETAEPEITARSPSTRRSTRTTGSRKKLLPTEGEQPELKIQPDDFQEGIEEKIEDARLSRTSAAQPETLQTNAEESGNEFNEEDFAEFKEGEAEDFEIKTPGENGIVVTLPPTSTEPDELAGSRRMGM